MNKQTLEARLHELEAEKTQLAERSNKSEDINEVRSINARMNRVNKDIEFTRSLMAEDKELPPASAEVRNADIKGAVVGTFATEQREDSNVLESLEYREAFRQLWTRGTPIPTELASRARACVNTLPSEQRAGSPINTSNTAAVIPLTIMNNVINTVKTPYGNIYNAVRKISVEGAVEYPVGAFEAEFNWVTEGTKAAEQDIGSVARVSFGYFEAELRITQTFLSSLLSLDAFEAEISKVIAKAYRKFMDYAIINGDGNGKMTGLAAGTTKTVTMTAAQMNDWRQWDKRFFAELVPGYEDGVFVFARSTVIKYLKTMADANNRPLFYEATGGTVGDGDRAYDRGYFYGREILMTVPTIVADFDTASQNDVIGYYFQPDNYVINENEGFTVDRYYNYARRKWITVATVVVDGKPINATGFVKILKG